MRETKAPFNEGELLKALQSLLDSLPIEPLDAMSLPAARRKRLRQQIESAIERLQRVALELDPVLQPPNVFDPSDPTIVGKLIANTLLEQDRHALG
ncbi:MAG TPA: hypothetical protein VJX67_05045, partial [Blastocatellia bacterium]|nr:hypothetical protein [Blastocatellia bacterium]